MCLLVRYARLSQVVKNASKIMYNSVSCLIFFSTEFIVQKNKIMLCSAAIVVV